MHNKNLASYFFRKKIDIIVENLKEIIRSLVMFVLM